MKNVVVSFKSLSDSEEFGKALADNGMSEEFRRSSSLDWYMSFPDEVSDEEGRSEVEEVMYVRLGYVEGEDYEF